MKLDKHIVDMFADLTKPVDDVKMEKTCYGTISVVDGTRYVKLDGSDLLVPAASTVKTSHGDRVTVLMKNHSVTVTGNLTAPATDGEGGSSGEAGTAATIKVGTVTTGEAGSSASVTNSGTTSAAVFDFVIPRGDKGEKGDTGPQGPQGEKGDTGTWDGTIPDHEHTVSDITDFPTSLPANGGNADTVDGKHSYEITPYHPVNDRPYSTLTARIENVGNEAFKTILRNNDGTINATAKFAAIADGGNSDTVNGNDIEMSIYRSTSSFGVSDTDTADTIWQAIPSNSLFAIEAQLLTDPSWNFPQGTGQYSLMMIKLGSRMRPLGIYLYPKSGGDVYFAYINSSGQYVGDWHRLCDGGDADTLDGLHANEIASNPNLLVNSYFGSGVINQRGKTVYTAVSGILTYTVDRWSIWPYATDSCGTLTVNDDGSLSIDGTSAASDAILTQPIENGENLVGKTVTISLEIAEIDGTIGVSQHFNSDILYISKIGIYKKTFTWQEAIKYRIIITNHDCIHYKLRWIKLEIGSVATPFCPPDPATELAKCQRYYYNSNGQIVFCARSGMVPYQNYYTLPVTMRANPTITVYDAEGTAGYASLRRDNSAKVAISTACANGRDFNLWAPNSDMTVNSEYRISFTASAEL